MRLLSARATLERRYNPGRRFRLAAEPARDLRIVELAGSLPPSVSQFLVEADDWFGKVMTRVGARGAGTVCVQPAIGRGERSFPCLSRLSITTPKTADDWFGKVMIRVGARGAGLVCVQPVVGRGERSFPCQSRLSITTPKTGTAYLVLRRWASGAAPREWRSAKQQSVRLSLSVQSILEVWGLGAS